jgi:selenide,water dikinase
MDLAVDENVVVGIENLDDAGVYRITDDKALVQTVDFFTPLVDDPYTFGRIAASNSMSDVYAMGGRPLTALNILCFPKGIFDGDVAREIIKGGLERIHASGAFLMGGHTVDDLELKYGLAVTGVVHPEKVITNSGGTPEDVLVLTKPLGTGVISTALKGGLASESAVAEMIASMVELNDVAGAAALDLGVRGGTDVTGFGFLGHLLEILRASHVGARIRVRDVPVFPDAVQYAAMGLRPCGLMSNRSYYEPSVDASSGIPAELTDLLYDPQTSGGLLLCVPPDRIREFLDAAEAGGIMAVVVGEITEEHPGRVELI